MASMADPIEDWCPQWAYGACRCESMCDDPSPASSAPATESGQA